MQCAVVEHFRNVVGLDDVASTEMNPDTSNPVIDLMPDQVDVSKKGGTMRLGAYPCEIQEGTLAIEIYKTPHITERHRHRYEFNNDYLNQMQQYGLRATGINPDNNLVEIVERPDHPFFIGVQYHPELKSRVELPHPIFVAFVRAAIQYKKAKELLAMA